MATNRIQGVTKAELNAHTEQALVELVYVREANDLLGAALGSLDSALNASQSVLNILQQLQNLHNSLSVKTNSALPFNFKTGRSDILTYPWRNSLNMPVRICGGGGAPGFPAITPTFFRGAGTGNLPATLTAGKWSFKVTHPLVASLTFPAFSAGQYQANYNKIASIYFGKPIDPYFVFTSSTDTAFVTFSQNLNSLKTKLAAEIKVISAITPASARADTGSLYQTLKNVYNGLPSNPLNFASCQAWALDNLNQHSGLASIAGTLQDDLTTAIVAAQSLNDTQKERVRRFLFIFQEYYQSASAVLSRLSSLIEKMAQKISG